MSTKNFNAQLFEEAGDGASGSSGGGAAGGAGAGAGGAAAGAAASGAGGGEAGKTALESAGGTGTGAGAGGGASVAAAGGEAGKGVGADASSFKFADKVLVAKDGATDWEATARNAEQARQHLERRMGSGDAPPASATEYKLNIPQSFAEKIKAEDLSKDKGFTEFTASLHGLQLSQKQYDGVVAEFLVRGEAARTANAVMAASDCTAALRAIDGWKSETEYTTQMRAAGAALKAYGGENVDALMQTYGNDPRFCQLLAGIGREMQEDSQANVEARQAASTTLEQLQSSPAYLNQNDPKHAQIVQQVTELTKRVHGDRPVVSGRSMSFNT